jgi:hypothetical protein
MKQTYTGGCHCGAVRYEADVDLSKGSLKCNCSICSKGRTWFVAVDGGDFRLQRGADALSEYQFGTNRIHHLFCSHCGIKSFARGNGPEGKQFVAIAVKSFYTGSAMTGPPAWLPRIPESRLWGPT